MKEQEEAGLLAQLDSHHMKNVRARLDFKRSLCWAEEPRASHSPIAARQQAFHDRIVSST